MLMVLVPLGVKTTIDIQFSFHIRAEFSHRTHKDLVALVPNQTADKAKPHDFGRPLRKGLYVVGTHPIVKIQETMRIELATREQTVAQKTTWADLQISGSVCAWDILLSRTKFGIFLRENFRALTPEPSHATSQDAE